MAILQALNAQKMLPLLKCIWNAWWTVEWITEPKTSIQTLRFLIHTLIFVKEKFSVWHGSFWKVWRQLPLIFIYFVFISTHMHSHIHTIWSSVFIRRGLSPFSSFLLRSGGKKPPRVAEPRFELEPALQQASALPTEPRCTLNWATMHPIFVCPHIFEY